MSAEIPEVVQCHRCKALHFNSDKPCPDCGAGIYWQCWDDDVEGKPLSTHEYAAKAYQQQAGRMTKKANQLTEKAKYHAEVSALQKATP